MAASPPANRSDLFARYEEALTGLANVPGHLQGELSATKNSLDGAMSSAGASVRSEEERLAKLRRTITTKYGESAKTLQAANVLMPTHVRAASGQPGGAIALAAAINAQQEAERAVALELQAAANAATKQATDEKARAAAGREAAEALKRRHEQVRKARQAADAEAERQRLADAARAKSSRQLMIGGGVVLLVLLVIVAALLLS